MFDRVKLKNWEDRIFYKNIWGVYKIVNLINNKIYVGSSIKIGKRIRDELHQLKNNKHHNKFLQPEWNKFGDEHFDVQIIEIISDTDNRQILIEREQYWIDKLKSHHTLEGYNSSKTARIPSGFTFQHTEETKNKISNSLKGKKLSKEHREILSKIRRGVKQKPETVAKRNASNTGKKRTPEQIALLQQKAIENAPKIGKKIRSQNSTKQDKPTSSNYKGVWAHRNKWNARIVIPVGQKSKSLGEFETQEEAAHNYDWHMINYFGKENVFLNFPDYDYTNFKPLKEFKNKEDYIAEKTMKIPPKEDLIGLTHQEIIEKYNVHRTTSLKWRKKYGLYDSNEKKSLQEEAIKDIRDSKLTVKELAEKYDISMVSVYNILNNVTYKDPARNRFLSGSATVSVNYNQNVFRKESPFKGESKVEVIKKSA
jgi:group I intron endonuclease